MAFVTLGGSRSGLLAGLGLVLAHGALAAVPPGGSAEPGGLSVCIDTAAGSAARDRAVAEAVARQEGVALAVSSFDGNGDDDGIKARQFRTMLAHQCTLVMGYPVDLTDPALPAETAATAPYDQTGFVLVVPAGSPATRLDQLAAGSAVAVTFETAPNLYLLDHPSLQADIHTTDGETLATVVSGRDPAGMVWQPTVTHYLKTTPGAALRVTPLTEPHARWNVVALHDAAGAPAAARFDAAVQALRASGALAHLLAPAPAPQKHAALAPALGVGFARNIHLATASGEAGVPALYTAAQASAGAQKFSDNCEQCHGAHLEGRAGPALRGPNFASVKAGFKVGEVFAIMAQQMPATNPGSLEHDDYVQIMAYVLQQNGYPAGPAALTFEGASASSVALLYRGK